MPHRVNGQSDLNESKSQTDADLTEENGTHAYETPVAVAMHRVDDQSDLNERKTPTDPGTHAHENPDVLED